MVWLGRGRSPMRHVYVDAEWPHDVHAYETRRRFQADYCDEACPSASLTPLKVQMLGFSSDLERFAVFTVDSSLELPQGPPLGVVAPPDGKPEASHRRSRVYETQERNAF